MIFWVLFWIFLFLAGGYFAIRKEGFTNSDIKDFFLNPKEYKNKGKVGERFLYRSLLEVGVSSEQIFRNVYIPVIGEDGKRIRKTTEIDVLVVSKKGLLVFEHKVRSGNIYGDVEREQWIQYLANKKYFFRNPVKQNRYHRECLERFIEKKVPVYSFITTSGNGKWKVNGLREEDHFIQREGDFKKMYAKLPDCLEMGKEYKKMLVMFAEKSRPTDGTREKHIREFCL